MMNLQCLYKLNLKRFDGGVTRQTINLEFVHCLSPRVEGISTEEPNKFY
jgi:hypothetical protein